MTDVVTYVEIDEDYCSLTYGTSPCTAAIDGDNPVKCYNCLATCQDRVNFANVPVTKRYAIPSNTLSNDIEAIPNIRAVSLTPGKISLGSNLGQRSSLEVTFFDHPHSDTGDGIDEYRTERTYTPWEQGTYWGKNRARQPYKRGRSVRRIVGTADQDIADMETRLFVIESFNGPNLDGTFTITAKDMLKMTDGDRALMPPLSPGYLLSSVSAGATSATLGPTGIGDTDYSASGVIQFGGKEICSFTRSGDVLTITRAQYNTEDVAHSANDRAQMCKLYQAEDPADVLSDLYQAGAGMNSSYIPLAAWQAETAAYYRRVVTTLIPEPTPVKLLASELIEQCGLSNWWDELGQDIRLMVLRAISTDAELYDDSNIVEGSLVVTEQPNKRLSQVQTYFGLNNPLKGVKGPDNYRSSTITIDTDSETNDGKAIHTIFSRWIPFGGLVAADRVNDIQLGRFLTAPRKFKFQVYRHGTETPELGEGCLIESSVLLNPNGSREQVPIQITRIDPGADVYTIEAEESRFTQLDSGDLDTRAIIIDADVNNVNLLTLHNTLYPTPTGGEVVEVTINSGVVVGSTSTSVAALIVGAWPTQAATGDRTSASAIITNLDVDAEDLFAAGMFIDGDGITAGTKILTVDSTSQITLDANATSTGTGGAITVSTVLLSVDLIGRVQGPGGKGGTGKGGDNNTGGNGLVGGLALFSRYRFDLDMSGSIRGGGAGGGGAGGDYAGWFGPQLDGDGGGGGAGRDAGEGGGLSGGGHGSPGQPGTLDAGGPGTQTDSPQLSGTGGAPGSSGANATGYFPGSGAAAGDAVDGWSYFEEGTITGSYTGEKVN